MSTHTDSRMMYMEGEASWCVMEAVDDIKEGGTEVMPTATPDPPETTGVEGDENRQGKAIADCWYCGKKGHRESECWKKRADLKSTGSGNGSGHTDKGNRQRSHYAEDSGRTEKASIFVTKHEANSMKQTTPKSDEVWYVDSGASNHMTSHKECFSYLEKPAQPGVVATGGDTPHPIANVGEVPLSYVGQKGKLLNVLHVPTITKNLVSVGQIVDQGMEYAGYDGLLVMRHRENSMMASNSSNSASTANSEHAWFVESGASHHMTSHQE